MAPVEKDQGLNRTRPFSGLFNVARKPTGSNHHASLVGAAGRPVKHGGSRRNAAQTPAKKLLEPGADRGIQIGKAVAHQTV